MLPKTSPIFTLQEKLQIGNGNDTDRLLVVNDDQFGYIALSSFAPAVKDTLILQYLD